MKTAIRDTAANLTALHASLKIDASGSGMHLSRHGSMQLRNAAGWTIKATAGTVWITQDEDVRDVILAAGQSFVIDRDGATLIYALDDARICVAKKSAVGQVTTIRERTAAGHRGWRFLPARALFA